MNYLDAIYKLSRKTLLVGKIKARKKECKQLQVSKQAHRELIRTEKRIKVSKKSSPGKVSKSFFQSLVQTRSECIPRKFTRSVASKAENFPRTSGLSVKLPRKFPGNSCQVHWISTSSLLEMLSVVRMCTACTNSLCQHVCVGQVHFFCRRKFLDAFYLLNCFCCAEISFEEVRITVCYYV